MQRVPRPVAPLLAALAIVVPAGATAETEADHLVRYGERVMGTSVALAIWSDDEEGAAAAADAVFDEFRRIDRRMSSWRDDSDVSRINAAAGKRAVKVSEEVFSLVRKANEMSRVTGGAFDITVGAFRGLWKFDEDLEETIPSDEEIKARTELVGYKRVDVDADARTVELADEGMRITLGGVAKGYAVDRAVSLLHDRGVLDFILQAGGDLYVSGTRGDRKWRVGIRDPRGGRRATFAVLELENKTFSTSGDYERGFVKDGVRYHHILDPRTGRPARTSRSVTVMADRALTADMWSTSLFVLGAEKGLPLVEKTNDLEAVFVDAEGELHISSGLEDRLRVLYPPTDAP